MICKCGSDAVEVRKRIAANGQRMVGRQCLSCGGTVGGWLKKADWPEGEIEDFDDGIREAMWNYETERREQRRAEEREEWHRRHRAVLASPEWRERRRKVFERERGLCQGCRDRPGDEVHHMTYDRLGCELLTDLVLFCGQCHDAFHRVADGRAALVDAVLGRMRSEGSL